MLLVGENPKEAGVLAEIDRVKKTMMRLKEITEKSKRIPVDSQAAKRLVKGSLWQPKDSSAQKRKSNGNSEKPNKVTKF